MLAGPITFYYLQALPVVILYAVVFFALGTLVGWFLWHEQKEEAERLRRDVEKAESEEGISSSSSQRKRRRSRSSSSSSRRRSK